MRKAFAVIGAWYGDEGKGLMTDYLANKHEAIVVRYNGGAQAGHTVVTPEGLRHVFHHFGSGTLAGAPTYLSKHFFVNPILFRREREELILKGITPVLGAAIDATITTPWDMAINQELEKKRGVDNHGSVGMGIYETFSRYTSGRSITLADLVFDKARVELARDKWAPARAAALGIDLSDHPVMDTAVYDQFMEDCDYFMENLQSNLYYRLLTENAVFEGAQGLLLDPEYGEMPYCTPSRCGMRNVSALAYRWGFPSVDAVYVSRSYVTRHGAGPLAGEHDMGLSDDTNVEHEFQGTLRYAPLLPNISSLRVAQDFAKYGRRGDKFHTAVTHLDQYDDNAWQLLEPTYTTYGPTRADVNFTENSYGTVDRSGTLQLCSN